MSRPPVAGRVFRFDRLLAGGRWAERVRVEIDGRGRIASLQAGNDDTACEMVDGFAVPGVPNVHSHAFQRAMAGAAEAAGPRSFWAWRKVMYRLVDRLTPQQVEAIARQLYIELLKHGFTCLGEFHYLHHGPGGTPYDDPLEMSRRIVSAARFAGIGLVHLPVVYETGGFGGEPLSGAQLRFRLDLDEANGICTALSPKPNFTTGLALHSLRAVRSTTPREASLRAGRSTTPSEVSLYGSGTPPASLEPSSRAGGSPSACQPPVHIHIAEPESEVHECLARRGARPVEWLLDNASVDERWCLVHSTHLSPTEAARVIDVGAVVGLSPATEANLGDGIFPLERFAGAGGRYAIGTDSHVSRSPAEELRILDYGQRLAAKARWHWRSSPEKEVAPALAGAGGLLLDHAWRDGCRALGWEAGELAPGLRADIAVLDDTHPVLDGREGASVLDSWIFSGPENPVRHVMVGGDWVIRDGRHPLEEEAQAAYAKCVRELLAGL